MVLKEKISIRPDRNIIFDIPFNGIKSILLMLIICYGSFYSFNPESNYSLVINFKRTIVISFILFEIIHIISGHINKSIFYSFILFNLTYLAFLLTLNSTLDNIIYFWLSVLFIASVFSHMYRLTQIDLKFFLYILSVSFAIVIGSFAFLIILYFGFEVEYVRKLFYTGFGNDYANFSVWAAYISILLTYLQVVFNQNRNLTFFYHLVLLFSAGIAGGRTGAIMIILSIVMNLYFCFKDSTKFLKIKILIYSIIFLLLVFYFAKDSYLLMRFSYFQGEPSIYSLLDYHLSGRLTIISGAMDIFLNQSTLTQIFLGHGIDNVYVKLANVNYQIHNFMIRFLLETGILGFISFMLIFSYPFFVKYRNNQKALTISLFLIGTLNALISPSSFFTGVNASAALWVMVAMSIQIGRNKKYLDLRILN
jgi:hypothetical protein